MVLKRVEIILEPEDLASLKGDMLRHFKTYGMDPSPHLQPEANADMERILDNLTTCIQLKGTIDDGEGEPIEITPFKIGG